MEERRPLFPIASRKFSQKRQELAPAAEHSFREFSRQVFAADALDAMTKQLIAVAVAHVTQCPYCIRSHTTAARREGASAQQIMEAIWVAAEMRAGAAIAHSLIALDAMEPDEDAPRVPNQ